MTYVNNSLNNTANETFTVTNGDISISAGNFLLPATTTDPYGILRIGAVNFLHAYTNGGGANTFLGFDAGYVNASNTSTGNTGIGFHSLLSVTSGSYNSCLGTGTGDSLTQGAENVFVGNLSGAAVTTSSYNTAAGSYSLNALQTGNAYNSSFGAYSLLNCTGTHNTSIGYASLSVTSGSYNTALGQGAGNSLVTTESSNIMIGNIGTAGDNNYIRLGTNGTGNGQQNRCVIAGVVTKPYTSAFSAYPNAVQNNVTGDSTRYHVACDTEIFDQNGDYNTGTYTFTAPVTGKYLLIGNVGFRELDAAHIYGDIRITTSNRVYWLNYGNYWAECWPGGAASKLLFSGSCIADMDSGDTAYLDCEVDFGTKTVDVEGGAQITYFHGELLC